VESDVLLLQEPDGSRTLPSNPIPAVEVPPAQVNLWLKRGGEYTPPPYRLWPPSPCPSSREGTAMAADGDGGGEGTDLPPGGYRFPPPRLRLPSLVTIFSIIESASGTRSAVEALACEEVTTALTSHASGDWGNGCQAPQWQKPTGRGVNPPAMSRTAGAAPPHLPQSQSLACADGAPPPRPSLTSLPPCRFAFVPVDRGRSNRGLPFPDGTSCLSPDSLSGECQPLIVPSPGISGVGCIIPLPNLSLPEEAAPAGASCPPEGGAVFLLLLSNLCVQASSLCVA
jgi:hypothetical protein